MAQDKALIPPLAVVQGITKSEPRPEAKPERGQLSTGIARWDRELQKFLGQPVTVEYLIGAVVHEVSGTIRAFNANSLHIIVDTDTEALMIRHPLTIQRGRKSSRSPSQDSSHGVRPDTGDQQNSQ